MFEIEMKFALSEPQSLRDQLAQIGCARVSKKCNRDTYFQHPQRDFRQTGEALRVRREDDVPMVTYKGPKVAQPASSYPFDPTRRIAAVKAREELEWRLDPGDGDGSKMELLLSKLGFGIVATVIKQRETYRLGVADHAMTITIDEVQSLGWYCEIETVLRHDHPHASEIESARDRVRELASKLGLIEPESRSYLRMLVEHQSAS